MSGFGQALRKERETSGVSLEAITTVTKISPRHLQALEEEEFKVLPGGVFNKGIVRGYARVVGLDEEEWVRRYVTAYEATQPTPSEDNDWVEFAQNASRGREAAAGRRPEMRLRWAGVLALLLCLSALSFYAWGFVQHKIAITQERPAPPPPPAPVHDGA